MTVRPRTVAIVLGAAGAAVALGSVRHGRRTPGREVPGGILIGHPRLYDSLSHRFLLGSFFDRIAADIARAAPDLARVLEVGCGPGRLSILVAGRHGLDVTGLDLDPAMIERARINADRPGIDRERMPSYVVGDATSLPFPDGSFDLIVSTLSMHHWADATAGLAEIGRVLRPGGRALVWDLRPGFAPFHPRLPDPVESARSSGLHVVEARPWRWPWRFALTTRVELAARAEPARRTAGNG